MKDFWIECQRRFCDPSGAVCDTASETTGILDRIQENVLCDFLNLKKTEQKAWVLTCSCSTFFYPGNTSRIHNRRPPSVFIKSYVCLTKLEIGRTCTRDQEHTQWCCSICSESQRVVFRALANYSSFLQVHHHLFLVQSPLALLGWVKHRLCTVPLQTSSLAFRRKVDRSPLAYSM